MARGESQTLLIWTIIFLIFSLIMIIVTVVMRSKYTEAASQLADATSKNQQLTTENSTLQQDGVKLRTMIGVVSDKSVADIETDFAGQIQLYAPTLNDPAPSFLTALKALSDSYSDKVTENKKLTDANAGLQSEIQLNNTQKEALRKELQAMVDQAKSDLASVQANHATQLTNLMETNQKLKNDADKVIEDSRVAIAEATKQRDTEIKRSGDITLINAKLTNMVAEMDSPVPTYADATILWVSSDSKTVRINLGKKHGLRPRMPFSVYSADAKEISVNSSKGKIEVTEIIDDNTAKALVAEDILVNPIIPGDIIYTPVWKPGQNIHVALLSGLDLDGDEVSDPLQIKMLIELCGGEVDAYIDDLTSESTLRKLQDIENKDMNANRLVGEIGNETRYLVTGVIPATDSPKSLIDAYRTLKSTAKDHGLQEISLRDMLTLMGQRPQSQTVGFGPRNRTANHYELQPDVVNQSTPGFVFKKFENPDAKPDTNDKVPVSPLFNQRKITIPSGTVSPLFQPRSTSTKDIESN